jgi:hypothetical protein
MQQKLSCEEYNYAACLKDVHLLMFSMLMSLLTTITVTITAVKFYFFQYHFQLSQNNYAVYFYMKFDGERRISIHSKFMFSVYKTKF